MNHAVSDNLTPARAWKDSSYHFYINLHPPLGTHTTFDSTVATTMIVIALLPLLAVCSCGLTEQLVEKPHVLAENFNIHVKNGKVSFHLRNTENNAVLRGELGVKLPEHLRDPEACDEAPQGQDCLQFGCNVQLTAKTVDHCYHLNWTTTQNITLSDCFHYDEANWYGGPENLRQYWPFNNMTFTDYSYITKMDQNQAVAEPYWVTSSGFYVYVDKTTPLFIDANHFYNNTLCLTAKQEPPYLPRGVTTLAYKICSYKNVKKAHMGAVKTDLGKPVSIPDHRMIQHPVWSTWVRFKLDVNETAVRHFAQEIVDNGFNNSQIEIDDNWETCYGSGDFNKSRFPDMRKLGADLHAMGFRVTLWKHPFVNSNCKLFKELETQGYLVKDQSGGSVSTWWDGVAGVVDFTNQEAADWFLNHHRKMMKENNIDNLKLDAGESSWLPQIPRMNANIHDQPDAFTAAYTRTVAQFGDMVEVRVGHLSQDLPIFVRMLDKDSKWSFENGLPTLLTTLFQLNLNGYTLVLPDMVGGNAYGTDVVTKEMFIRWLQANTFLPAIQFSVAPWDFDNETVQISKKFTALHYAFSDKIISRMEECVRSGVPVNAPIWWVAPKDPVAQNIWSEYMLGDDLLVAPVVEKGAVSRDIYLPKGRWRDEAGPDHKIYRGPQWLRNYPAPLDVLPFFTRVSSCDADQSDEE